MNRDEHIRQQRLSGASWPALLVVYGLIVATMLLSAAAIT